MAQWLRDHPSFAGNPLYIGGDAYSGIVAPILVKDILHGNSLYMDESIASFWINQLLNIPNYLNPGLEVGLQPKMELQVFYFIAEYDIIP